MNIKTLIGQLRILAILEGISYLMLFAITMPVKYIYELSMPNQIVGMAHGILFVAFCLWVIKYGLQQKWSKKVILIGLISSLLPFGTFVFDAKYLKQDPLQTN